MRNAETVLGVIAFVQDKDHWRAAVRLKDSSPVRRGAVGKGLREMHLAGRLPYGPSGSMSGEWKRCIRHRATPRLYSLASEFGGCAACNGPF